MHRGKAVRVFLFSLFAIASFGQGTREDYQRAERFLPWNNDRLVVEAEVGPRWIENTDKFWYRKSTRNGPKEFLLADPAGKTRGPAFDHAKLAASLSQFLKREYKADRLPFDDFEFVRNGAAIQFEVEDATWTCTLANYECTKQPAKPSRRVEGMSPDGRWQAFVRDYNLLVRYLPNGQEVQLTRDGEKWYDYATPLPMGSQLIARADRDLPEPVAVFWSPDSTRLVTYRIDSRHATRFTTIQSVPPNQLRPRTFTYAYPLPGEALSTAQPIIFDVVHQRRIEVDTPVLEIMFTGGPGFQWSKDGKRFYFDPEYRGYQRTELRETDAATGKTRVILEEKSDTFVDPGTTMWRAINDGAEILWTSERDGWNHVYLYDGKTGQLKNQVTKGPWLVRSIVRIDEKARQVYFLGAGREPNEDPYQTHLYRVNLDGTGLRLLTPENANHTAQVSPAFGYFVDAYSRPDLPTKIVLRRTSDGEVVMPLEETNVENLLKAGYKYPEAFHGKGRDGKVDMYGLIWRPTSFDPSKKYPVIEQIYTGPQGFFVPKSFGAYRNSAQSTAELGFIVVMIDGQGTGGRSKAFHNFSYKNLGDGGIDDHIAVLKQMAEKYPYMDLDRVGLYGGSAGAYDTVHAMLTHPKFYKVGVSMSGNHDHRMDKAWWNELWMGYPVGDNYREQSNVTMAGNLEGKLLVMHGDLDDNVNPSATLQLVDALIKANKDFEMLIVPNQYHGEGRNPYVIRKRWDFFVRNLLGVEPPAGYAIKAPEPGAGFGPMRRGASN